MKGGYFLLNGQFYKEQDAVFSLADLHGKAEGISEYFRAEYNEILFSESISGHLHQTAQTIGMDLTEVVGSHGRQLRRDVSRLLNKNKLYLAARVEIQLFPSGDRLNCVLFASEMARGYYPVQDPGLILSFYDSQLKDIRATPSFCADGLFLWQEARRKAKELQRPNMILLNRDGSCCESIGGSFALLNKDCVVFPAAASGGYRCAIRNEVERSVREAGFSSEERENIKPEELLEAEELFLFDACHGVEKVLGLEDRRYYSTKTDLIARRLSELARKDREERV